MSDDFSMFREAYDSRTGKKLPYLVPESHFDAFPYLRKTPPIQGRHQAGG